MIDVAVTHHLKKIKQSKPDSHKGQNGKLLIIGGSELFHAASKWSLDIASKFVDMVFYASVPGNNELIQAAKGEFWNGIVIKRETIEEYIEEADCILIGPGMTRSTETSNFNPPADGQTSKELTKDEWNTDTEKVVNYLLAKYPEKKWVIDAGALQMVDPSLLNENCIITPHKEEAQILLTKVSKKITNSSLQTLVDTSGCAVLLKGEKDSIYSKEKTIEIEGGNAGMTKGGTGDVLAGLVAALYCTQDKLTATVVGSYTNKKAGDSLYKKVGTYFNASDLVNAIPQVLWKELRSINK